MQCELFTSAWIYAYLLYFIVIQNMHELEFDLSRSLKDEVNGAIRKPMYDILLENNSKCMPILSILWDIAIQTMSDFEFDLSRSPKVEGNGAIRKPIYDFLLVNNSKYMPICGIL